MKYASINFNDMCAAPGVSVSVYLQGCPHHCKGCHNPETWDFEGGQEFTFETMQSIIKGLSANGIKRSLAIMGGEPLCEANSFLTLMIIEEVKRHIPDVKIYIWSGYTYDALKKSSNAHILQSLQLADCLIDGPYIEELRDITLPMRGSSNQNIIYLKEN
jgi:anaerobic ribonucleoside-triphosphate reductase activating protein